jgi:hypothetical protein
MDSRATLRYAVDLPASIAIGSGGSPLSCTVRNVSLGGVFIRGPLLPSGTRVALTFGAAGSPDIHVTCTARWTTNDGTGLQFEGLGTVDTHMLARFVRVAARPTGRIPTDAVLRRTQS